MRLERIQKKKIHWTTIYVYASLCCDYFNNKPHNEITIITLEKILFLMQYESITEYKIPLLVYKTYIYNNKIYLRYLSDLLRVTSPHTASDNRYFIFMKVKKYKYKKMMDKYSRLSVEELDNRISDLVIGNQLPPKYYSYEKYTRKDMRICARIQVDYKGKLIAILGLLSLPCIASAIILLINIFGGNISHYSVTAPST